MGIARCCCWALLLVLMPGLPLSQTRAAEAPLSGIKLTIAIALVSEEPGPQIAYFDAAVTARLLESGLVHVADRASLRHVLDELALNIGVADQPLRIGQIEGVDLLLLVQTKPKPASAPGITPGIAPGINLTLVAPGDRGAREAAWSIEWDQSAPGPEEIERHANAVADRIVKQVWRRISRREPLILVSITRPVVRSPLASAVPLSYQLAHHMRARLEQTPGVLVLERERVDELYRDSQLQRGGLLGSKPDAEVNTPRHRYVSLVSELDDSQREGGKREAVLRLTLTTLGTSPSISRTVRVAREPEDQLFEQVTAAVQELVTGDESKRGQGTPLGVVSREAEADVLMLRVMEMAAINHWQSAAQAYVHFKEKGDTFWGYYNIDSWFRPDGEEAWANPARMAQVHQAVAYARAAVMLAPDNVNALSLLSTLLADEHTYGEKHQEEAASIAVQVARNPRNPKSRKWAMYFLGGHGAETVVARGFAMELLGSHDADDVVWAVNLLGKTVRVSQLDDLRAFAEEMIRLHPSDTVRAAVDQWLGAREASAYVGMLERTIRKQIGRDSPRVMVWPVDDQLEPMRERLRRHLLESIARLKASGKSPHQVSSMGLYLWGRLTRGMIVNDGTGAYVLVRHEPQVAAAKLLIEELQQIWSEAGFDLWQAWAEAQPWTPETGPSDEGLDSMLHALQLADDARRRHINYRWPVIRAEERALDLLQRAGRYHDAYAVLRTHLEYNPKSRCAPMLGPLALREGAYDVAAEAFEQQGEAAIVIDGIELPATHWTRLARSAHEGKIDDVFAAARHGFGESRPLLTWSEAPVDLSKGTIYALLTDGDWIWVGSSIYSPDSNYRPWNGESEEKRAERFRRYREIGGLIGYDTVTGQTIDTHILQHLPSGWVMDLVDGGDVLYVATYLGGIGIYEKATGQWRSITEADGLPSDHIRALALDGDALWIAYGRRDRGGVARYQLSTGQTRLFLPADYPTWSVPSDLYEMKHHPPINAVTDIAVTDRYVFAVSQQTREEGLFVYDKVDDRWQRLHASVVFRQDEVKCVLVAPPVDAGDVPTLLVGGNKVHVFPLDTDAWDAMRDWQRWTRLDEQHGLTSVRARSMALAGPRQVIVGGYQIGLIDIKTLTTQSFIARENRSIDIHALAPQGSRLWVAFHGRLKATVLPDAATAMTPVQPSAPDQ